jgi:hypothetical protein
MMMIMMVVGMKKIQTMVVLSQTLIQNDTLPIERKEEYWNHLQVQEVHSSHFIPLKKWQR